MTAETVLTGARAIAAFAGVSPRQVGNWRRDYPECPIELVSKRMSVTEGALRGWFVSRGWVPPEYSPEGPPEPLPAAPGASPSRDPSAPVARPEGLPEGLLDDFPEYILDPEAFAALPEPTGDVEGDLIIARKVSHRLHSVVASWRVSALADPRTARLFGQFNEILSKVMTRIAGLESSFIKLQQQRGELLSLERVGDLLAEFSAFTVGELDALINGAVDDVKAAEIAAHKKSRIDSATLTEKLELRARTLREHVAGKLADAGSSEG